jgi:RNA polymerase sigma factor (sigma-70 family)
MANAQLDLVLRHIRKMVDGPGATRDCADQELLGRFATHHEEAVFEVLMQRHGPMVLGVSQRVLSHEQDAEDVFQATFLVLAGQAKSIRKQGSLASWLYGVAYRLALKLKASAGRRRARERRVAKMMASGTIADSHWSDLRPILDEELSRLPEKYRAPLILCYLEGKTNVEAGRMLGWPAGSMSKRLARGRELLRSRLTKRGLALSSPLLATLVTEHAQASIPAALLQSSLKLAVMVGAGQALTGVVSTQVGTLIDGVIKTMFMTKVKVAIGLLLGAGLLGITSKIVLQPSVTATPENPVQEAAASGLANSAADNQPELALVPKNAQGFAHIAVRDLWTLEAMKTTREQLAKSEAFQDLEKTLGIAVADIQSITFIMLPLSEPSREPVILTAITTSRPVSRDKLLGALVPEAQEQQHQGKTYFLSKKTKGPAVHLAGERLLLMGDPQALESYFDRLGWAPAASPLSPGLKLAEQKHAVVAAFQVSDQLHDLLTKGRDHNEDFYKPLLDVQSGTLIVDVNQEARLKARFHFANESTAKEARNALAVGLDMIKRYLATPLSEEMKNDELFKMIAKEAIGAVESAQLSQEKTAVQVTMETKSLPFIAMAVPAVQKTRVASRRMQSVNNLKQIALAMHNYHDAFGRFPPQALTDNNGKPTLSWRVAILPFIEQDNLYRQFKLDEPWDSEHNKKLLEKMPPIYAPVNARTKEKYQTFYQAFAGKGTVFEPGEKITFANITDGSSNTLMVVEAADPVPWTKPEDLPFDPEKPLPKLGGEFPDLVVAAFCDGSVHIIEKKKLDDKLLRALITRNGLENVNPP